MTSCVVTGNIFVYGLLPLERIGFLWLIAAVVGLICATVIIVLRRFGLSKVSVAVTGLFLLVLVGVLVWVEANCIEAFSMPPHFEGDKLIDNDGTIRSLMLIAGIVTPASFLGVIGTLLPWFWPRLSRQRGAA